MKIILISNLKNLGKIGDTVEVKSGYARNYLIPQGFAIYYSEENYKGFKARKETIEAKNKQDQEIALENQKKLANKEIVILENAGDDGRLYGSVSSVRLAKVANQLLGSDILKKSNIKIREAIKNVGKYKIILELHPEVSFEKEIIVARTKEEAGKIKSGQWEKEQKAKLEAQKKEKELEFKVAQKSEAPKEQPVKKEEVKEIKKEEKKKAKKEVKTETKKEKKVVKEKKKKESKKAKKEK